MNRIKFAAIFLIIGIGIAGAYFIVKNNMPDTGKPEDSAQKRASFTNDPIKWIENAASGDSGSNSKNENLAASNSANGNLTNLLGASMFNKMKTMDQNGKNPFENFDFLNDPQYQDLLNSSVDDFTPRISINDSDLKISKDNSAANKSKYLDLLIQIINLNQDAVGDPIPALDRAIKTGETGGVIKIADGYKKIYGEFLDISAPSDYSDIHKRYLAILKTMENAYRGAADISNDPVKASIFMNALPNIMRAEGKLRQEYYNRQLQMNANRL